MTCLALALLALAPAASADDVPPPTAWVCSGDFNECAYVGGALCAEDAEECVRLGPDPPPGSGCRPTCFGVHFE